LNQKPTQDPTQIPFKLEPKPSSILAQPGWPISLG
jgi:hypothetical protein